MDDNLHNVIDAAVIVVPLEDAAADHDHFHRRTDVVSSEFTQSTALRRPHSFEESGRDVRGRIVYDRVVDARLLGAIPVARKISQESSTDMYFDATNRTHSMSRIRHGVSRPEYSASYHGELSRQRPLGKNRVVADAIVSCGRMLRLSSCSR